MKNLEIKNVDCHATLAMTKNVQSGRSMIEMLGVLAIIGVPSVGGIAGYSKAMQKYRINKTIEQITLIAGNVRTFFAPQRSYDVLTNTVIKKAKLVPDEMWNSDKTALENVFGERVILSEVTMNDGYSPLFYISYNNIPEEACIEIVTHNWSDISDLVSMAVMDDHDYAFLFDCYENHENWSFDDQTIYGCRYVAGTLPITLEGAVKGCAACNDECDVVFAFK
ncbi:MAG: hypothetical protein IKO06_04615 [Alphaproteobacteria bacterium]|nr:hypothetical protein [Alphaproteobacteria bacterium]